MKQPRYVSVTTHIIIEKAKQEKVLTKKLHKESKILLLNFPLHREIGETLVFSAALAKN